MSNRRLYCLIALLTGTALISNIAASSRGAQIALAVELVLLSVLAVKVRPRTIIMAVLTAVIGWNLVPAEQKARFESMGEDETSRLRIYAWGEAWKATLDDPLTGVGYNNWAEYFSFGDNREIHNTVLEASAELGLPGALLFLGAVGTSFVMNARTRRRARRQGEWAAVYRGMALGLDMAMVGLFVACQFITVLFFPSFWMAFALTVSLAETVRRADVVGTPRRRAAHMPAARVAMAIHRPSMDPTMVPPQLP
jgi:O-antigen ligase